MKLLILIGLVVAAALHLRAQPAAVSTAPATFGSVMRLDAAASAQSIEEAGLRQLLTIRRVFVERLTGGETAAQMRDIIISSLEESKLFILTENQEKSDAIVRGAAEDLVFTELHQSSDGVNAKLNVGSSRGASGYRADQSGGLGIGENESERSAQRRHEAIASVRITNKDGDVIWSTTQESQGAKYHGASADVADKIAAKLKDDFDRARKIGK